MIVGYRDNCDDALAEPFVGRAEHHGIRDVGMHLQHRLDLFGIHLLAAGVDAQRAPAEQMDGAVGVDGRHVARQ